MIKRKIELLEQRLKNYTTLEYKIKMLEMRVEKEKMSGSPREIGAVDFGKIGHGSGGTKSAVMLFTEIRQIIDDINDLKFEQQLMQTFLKMIEQESKEEREFIRLYYFESKTVPETLVDLGYSYNSRNTLYRIRNNVLNKLDTFIVYGLYTK